MDAFLMISDRRVNCSHMQLDGLNMSHPSLHLAEAIEVFGDEGVFDLLHSRSCTSGHSLCGVGQWVQGRTRPCLALTTCWTRNPPIEI